MYPCYAYSVSQNDHCDFYRIQSYYLDFWNTYSAKFHSPNFINIPRLIHISEMCHKIISNSLFYKVIQHNSYNHKSNKRMSTFWQSKTHCKWFTIWPSFVKCDTKTVCALCVVYKNFAFALQFIDRETQCVWSTTTITSK